MRVAVSNAPIVRSRLKPRPSRPSASVSSSSGSDDRLLRHERKQGKGYHQPDQRPLGRRLAATRRKGNSSATIAGKVAFPRSPAKL